MVQCILAGGIFYRITFFGGFTILWPGRGLFSVFLFKRYYFVLGRIFSSYF